MSRIQVNMHEAKSNLSKLAEQAWLGDEIVIAKSGKPYLHLIPHSANKKARVAGHYKGEIKICDNFDQTSDDILDDFDFSSTCREENS